MTTFHAKVDPTTLRRADDNPQRMKPHLFSALKLALENDSDTIDEPAVWKDHRDGTLRIISGHHRIKAAIELGWKELSVKVFDDPKLDEVWYRKRVLSVNKTHGEPDDEAMRAFLERTLGIDGIDMDTFFEDTGYQYNEVSAYLATDALDLARAAAQAANAPGATTGELPTGAPVSSVRMVQVFLDNTSHPLFMQQVKELMAWKKYANITDVVRAAVDELHERAAKRRRKREPAVAHSDAQAPAQ